MKYWKKKPLLFQTQYIYPNAIGTTSISFKNFDLLTSHHDIHKYNINSANDTIDKYKRRYKRLIHTIQTEKCINFIRYCKDNNDMNEKQIYKFFENIANINSGLNFKFILVSDNNKLLVSRQLRSHKNFVYINLNKYTDYNTINEKTRYLKIIKQYKCIYSIIT